MAETKEKEKTRENTEFRKNPIRKQSFPNAKSKVDTAGYMSLERRVKSLQHAGQILHQARAAQFDGTNENHVAPPMRGYEQDLADLSELARTNQTRMDEINRKVIQRQERQKKAKQETSKEVDKTAEKTDVQKDEKSKKTKPSDE